MGLFDKLNVTWKPRTKNENNLPEGMEAVIARLIDDAQRHAEKHEPAKALEFYNKAAALAPTHGKLHFLRGNVQLELDDARGAIESYQIALAEKPDSAGSQFNLGNAYGKLGNRKAQLQCYTRAIEINPNFADALVALSLSKEEEGKPEEAEELLVRALKITPDSAGTLFNLGTLQASRGHVDEAISNLQKAISSAPDYTDAHIALCCQLLIHGREEEAQRSLKEALKRGLSDTETLNNLGAMLKNAGHPALAIRYYREALKIDPDNSAVLNNLGVALKGLGELDEGYRCFQRCIALQPDFAPAYLNFGTIQFMREEYLAAVESYKHSLSIDPTCFDSANNLGAAYQSLGRFDEAAESYQKAISLRPIAADPYNNLGNLYASRGLYEEASAAFRQALQHKPDFTTAFSNLLFTQNYSPFVSAESLFKDASEFGNLVERLATPFKQWNISRESEKTLRIGFLSGDLVQHPVGFFFESILRELSTGFSKTLQVCAFHNNWRFDPLSQRVKEYCTQWHTTYHLSDKELAELIHAEQIDILIDLAGHTAKNRLPVLAWRPAPVQVSWLGYFATTGVRAIEYLIADPWTLPASEEIRFTERIVRLPQTRLCFTQPQEFVAVAPLPALLNGHITFGCFNNISKLTDAVVLLWSKILLAIPNSRLILKARQLQDQSVKQELLNRFTLCGLVEDRLILQSPGDRSEYFAAYNAIDIALDPFPYTGGTTTVEALWMGVPVLTLAGDSFLSRQGVGLLQNAGLQDWIAGTRQEYLNIAVSRANDVEQLSRLRSSLRQQVLDSPIFDAATFAMHFDHLLRDVWRSWCASKE